MLRNLTLRNFVHFHDEQTFSFNGGPYFFIGENRSGKTCCCEAIRRCMSTSKNFFMSTSHDKTELSYVICEYVRNHTDDGQPITIYSCVVGIPDEKVECRQEIKVKLVIEKSKENKLYVDLVKKNKDGYPVNRMFPMNDATHNKFIEKLLGTDITTESLKCFVSEFIMKTEFFRSFISQLSNYEYDATTDCEKYLKETIDVDVVLTEPMRNVSAVQWTNSPKFDNLPRTHEGVDRFSYEMRDNCEILTWYLDNQKISGDERKTVDSLFDLLTDGSRLRFEKMDGAIQVIDNGNTVTLEKAPEGVLEAKICAILLSIQQFKTICLEEPGKGMHIQMIERLRDLVLKKIKDKTIIMTSHNPAFLISWNIEKIFLFLRQSGERKFKAVQGNRLLSADEHKARRIVVDHGLSTIFFASRVLLVEGLSEEVFLSAMKSILLDDGNLAQKVIQCTAPSLTINTLNRFLYSLHILNLRGERNKLRFAKICTALALERYFILDYDAIVEKNESTSKFFREFDIEGLEREFKRDGVAVLESRGLFVWAKPIPDSQHTNQKGGTIEDAMIKLVHLHGEKLKSLFNENNAALNWDFKNNIKRKLFKDRKLTEHNIDVVVQGIIQACLEHTDSDVYRLMNFIIRGAVTQAGNDSLSVIYRRP